ncbi:hypothetical protein BWK59_12070 [Flavobacterium davisii]|uniref:Uncharacterized protein n=2 Tax=Flavobacterium davisii TaxID=2906077 RepID=A0A246GG50_9FLAO|nr:hypothetical protein [Flavobacterium davisii]OWP83142.1 hypothetical protein BWK59_12070 [Flavobacterium davisii]
MKKSIKLFFLLLIVINTVKCKENTKNISKKNNQVIENANIKDTIVFDKIEQFNTDTSGDVFTLNEFYLKYNNENNSFNLLNKKINQSNDITFNSNGFDGDGFNVYMYKTDKYKNVNIILFEALAEIGTAWYNIVVFENNKLIKNTIIKDPRANDTTLLKNFLSILNVNKHYILKFEKKLIANYSSNPKNYQQTDNYCFLNLDNNIVKNKMDLGINEEIVNENYKLASGTYEIKTKIEKVKDQTETNITCIININDNEALLSISTEDILDAYCEGKYKIERLKNNIFKLEYKDEGICSENEEDSNIYIKIENSNKYSIHSNRFLNTDWQKLTKK